jgi:hypothetical protein
MWKLPVNMKVAFLTIRVRRRGLCKRRRENVISNYLKDQYYELQQETFSEKQRLFASGIALAGIGCASPSGNNEGDGTDSSKTTDTCK